MAGRHVDAKSLTTFEMADGVKGLLIAKRPSLVVCALASLAESRRMCSGFGGSSIRSGVGVIEVAESEVVNWLMRATVVFRRSRNERVSSPLGRAIVQFNKAGRC